MIIKKIALAVMAMGIAGAASAGTTLTGNMTVDNSFSAYLSTNDSTLGTLIGSGGDWWVAYGISGVLTPGVTNYLHVVATNAGGPGAFIGSFSLDNSGFSFSNGTQTLLTNTTDWNYSSTGFGSGYSSPVSVGGNGVGPWGFRPGISNSAQWLNVRYGSATDYFSTTIAAAVPEPETYAMMMAGLGLLGFVARRRKQNLVA